MPPMPWNSARHRPWGFSLHQGFRLRQGFHRCRGYGGQVAGQAAGHFGGQFGGQAVVRLRSTVHGLRSFFSLPSVVRRPSSGVPPARSRFGGQAVIYRPLHALRFTLNVLPRRRRMDALSVHGMGGFHPGFRQRRMRLNRARELGGG